mgnify:FL=1
MMIFDLILSREQNSNEYQLNMAHDMIQILTEVKTIPLGLARGESQNTLLY